MDLSTGWWGPPSLTKRPAGLEAKTMCSGTTTLTDLTNTFTDHVLPSVTYRSNMQCQWNVQTPSYTQQMEWWVDRLSLHPGKSFTGAEPP